jgi:hypothetical protein
MGYWRDFAEMVGIIPPSDISMGHTQECHPRDHTLCANCGNFTRTECGECSTCHQSKKKLISQRERS